MISRPLVSVVSTVLRLGVGYLCIWVSELSGLLDLCFGEEDVLPNWERQ